MVEPEFVRWRDHMPVTSEVRSAYLAGRPAFTAAEFDRWLNMECAVAFERGVADVMHDADDD